MPDFIAQGIDYAWSRPRYNDLKGAGVKFVMRYISHDRAKDLLGPEAQALAKVGVPVGLVFETTASRSLAGFNAGRDDAEAAASRVSELSRSVATGISNIPIYFAVDFDAVHGQLPAVAQYLRGAAEVLSKSRVGVYGSYQVVKYMSDHDVCDWHWQTYAWSHGVIFGLKTLLSKPLGKLVVPAAHIYQYRNGVTVAGASADWNKATAEGLKSLRPAPRPTGPSLAYLKRRLAIRKKDLKSAQKRVAYIRSRIAVLEKKISDAAKP